MANAFDLLTVPKLTGAMQGLQAVQTLPSDLMFASALPLTPAVDGELWAMEVDHPLIADIITDDSAANVYQTGKLAPVSYTAPRIKIGRSISEEQLTELARVSANEPAQRANGIDGYDPEFAGDFINRRVDGVRLGCWERLETVAIAMHLGSYNYNRFGYQINGSSWGLPQDLQVRVTNNWSDPVNGDGGNDIINMILYAKQRYGKVFNRMTLSLQAFRSLINQAKFQALARLFLAPNVSYVNLPLGNINYQQQLAAQVLGLDTIRFYDRQHFTKDVDTGNVRSFRYLPINKVILDNPENDHNADIQDIGNCVVTEAVVQSMLKAAGVSTGVIGSFDFAARGPISYATVSPHMNPVNVVIWGVMKAWPRRKQQCANAVLDVGPLVDSIPATEPVLI